MTDREKVIKDLKRCVLPHGNGCTPECEYHGRIECCRQVMRKALALLKAQEPQPPIIVNGRRFQIKKCPKCYMTIKADEKPNFCSNCGQAVKWDG